MRGPLYTGFDVNPRSGAVEAMSVNVTGDQARRSGDRSGRVYVANDLCLQLGRIAGHRTGVPFLAHPCPICTLRGVVNDAGTCQACHALERDATKLIGRIAGEGHTADAVAKVAREVLRNVFASAAPTGEGPFDGPTPDEGAP